MPINLETINSFYDKNLKPYEVDEFLDCEIAKSNITKPKNFEEKAITLIGKPLYEAFIKGYTKKQWQIDPINLPEAILTRLPFRKNYNESYYFSKYQGIPLNGYAEIFEKMLKHKNIDVMLNTDFFDVKDAIPESIPIIYSGPIDRLFNYKFGKLDWRTLKFELERPDVEDFQGTSVMNYAEESVPFTRIHEPRHLHPEASYTDKQTLIIKEVSMFDNGDNPYYPVNDEKNQELVIKYRAKAEKLKNIHISGRLGDYKYYDMHQTIENALDIYYSKLKKAN